MVELQVVRIGDTPGVVFPAQVLGRLGVVADDRLALAELQDGGYRLLRQNPELERQIALAEEGTERYAEALAGLAR